MSLRSFKIIAEGGRIATVANAQAQWSERRGLLLLLGDEGIGEASPLPGYSRETLEDCRAELEQLHPDLDDPFDHNLALPAARFAAETAVLDLIAHRRGCSISSVLGRARDRVPLSAVAMDDADVERAVARGITTVKIKVGAASIEEDVARVAALRNEYGDRIALRLDANQAWSPEEADRALRLLEPYAPELVEEPSSDWTRLHPHVPLALDESLQRFDDAQIEELASRKLIAALVLKPMALGGFSRCLRLARIAQAHDLACIVTHLFDGPVALAAAAELALALPGRVLACGLDRHRGLSAYTERPLPQIREDEIVAIG